MKRLAFNGGEISPNMALRADMDVYARSCTTLTNFNVASTGGISRRPGMLHICNAQQQPSILIPYKYDENNIFLIELGADFLHVRDPKHNCRIIQSFHPDDNPATRWQYPSPANVSFQQINAILLILSQDSPVMALTWETPGDSWSFAPFDFATPPWQTEDLQDDELTLTPTQDGLYTPTWNADGVDTTEQHTPDPGDLLRASYYTARAEAADTARNLQADIDTCTYLSPSTPYTAGQKLAIKGPEQYEYYICTADFKTTDFVQGCISPANYPDNFMLAEDLTGFDDSTAIYELTERNFSKGDKIVLHSGYWQLYTCIRDFTPQDLITGLTSPADYPRHFMRGIQVGQILPCGGKWEFYCSGTWYGSYSIARNYGSGSPTEPWEHAGESRSSLGSSSNTLIAGDEEDEPCHLRLTLDSVRIVHPDDPAAGWPQDKCANKLIVFPYRHNMKLITTADGLLEDESPIATPLKTPLATYDWSFCAFNSRNGYPRCATLHESRLVLASTPAQPQTIWLSKSDDLNNFATGDLPNSGMLLTMATTSQAAICWMLSHADVIMLGTVDSEWVLKPASGSVLTPDNAKILNHGYRGSAPIPAVKADGRVLFCERGSGRIYDYGYNYETDGYTSQDLTIFADHIATAAGGITSGTVIKKPYCCVAFTTNNGELLLMTYNTLHNVNAWHRYTTKGTIHAACALPNGNNPDNLYLITSRTNPRGETSRRIELVTQGNPCADGEEQFPFTSTMETTAFAIPDANVRELHQPKLSAYFLTPIPANAVTTSTGNGYATTNISGTIPQGWADIITTPGWSSAPYIGIQITGPNPCTILAVQA